MISHIRLTALATAEGINRAHETALWAQTTYDHLADVFLGTPQYVLEMAPAIGILLLDLKTSIEAIIKIASESTNLDIDAVGRFNRCAAVQSAVLNLFNHVQRFAQSDLKEHIPAPSHHFFPECTCGNDCRPNDDVTLAN